MKTLLTIFILFFSNVVLCKELTLFDFIIGSKLTKHFSSTEISRYYQDDMEKNAKGEKVWGKNLKYSAIAFYGTEIGDAHDIIQIYFENATDKIVATSGLITDLEFDECIKIRDFNSYTHESKKLLVNFSKEENYHNFPDGMADHYIAYYGEKFNITFRCYVYEDGRTVFRYSSIEKNYNDWVFNRFNEE